MKIHRKKTRVLSTVLLLVLAGLLLLMTVLEVMGRMEGQGPGIVIFGVCCGVYAAVWYRMMRRTPLKGFDCVAGYFPEEQLIRHMEQEPFTRVSKYISVSRHWLCFRGQYVPKNFVLGAYGTASMDQSDVLHLALITGETCHGFVHEKDTMRELERLRQLLPHADILNPGSRFGTWWRENREGLARRMKDWAAGGRDFWGLVYNWYNIAGWETEENGSVDDSEEYFRDYPEEKGTI